MTMKMRDPHVQTLHYQARSEEWISYDNPGPIAVSNHFGDFDLHDGSLTVSPRDHFAAQEEAQNAIEPYLRAWEIEADLTSNLGRIRFEFVRVEMIDRDPPPAGSPQVISAQGIASGASVASLTLHAIYNAYPNPPTAFRSTAEVDLAYKRWVAFRAGKESLQSMAYLC